MTPYRESQSANLLGCFVHFPFLPFIMPIPNTSTQPTDIWNPKVVSPLSPLLTRP